MISSLLRVFARLGWFRADFIASRQPNYPSDRKEAPNELVVVAAGDIRKWACLTCPGGCGARIALSLNPNHKPRWSVAVDCRARAEPLEAGVFEYY